MKIGVLSDTHIPYAAARLPEAVRNAFKVVDMILHAGDLVSPTVLDELNSLATTYAVRGNMDDTAVRQRLPEKLLVKAGKFNIGLIHGYGAPYNLIEVVKKEFMDEADAIVFGHSHVPVNEDRDGTLFFNPGSPTDKIFAKFNSFGILTANKTLKGEIIKIR